jgi:hypothetical protein
VIGAAIWFWRRRPAWTATLAYQRLRRSLTGAGLPIRDSTAPLALARVAARRLPDVAEPAARLVEGYLEEAFAERAPGPEAIASLKRDLDAVEASIRRAHRARGRRRRAA